MHLKKIFTLTAIAGACAALGLSILFYLTVEENAQQQAVAAMNWTSSQPGINSPSDRVVGPNLGDPVVLAGIDPAAADWPGVKYDAKYERVDDEGRQYSGFYREGFEWLVDSNGYTGKAVITIKTTGENQTRFLDVSGMSVGVVKDRFNYNVTSWSPLDYDFEAESDDLNILADIKINIELEAGQIWGFHIDAKRTAETEPGTVQDFSIYVDPLEGDSSLYTAMDRVQIHSHETPW